LFWASCFSFVVALIDYLGRDLRKGRCMIFSLAVSLSMHVRLSFSFLKEYQGYHRLSSLSQKVLYGACFYNRRDGERFQ